MDGEEQQGCGLVVDVGEVGAFEDAIGRQGLGFGQVEAEGEASLEPGLDGVAVGRDDLGLNTAGERGEMLVEEFGGERVGLMDLTPAQEGHGQHKGCG